MRFEKFEKGKNILSAIQANRGLLWRILCREESFKNNKNQAVSIPHKKNSSINPEETATQEKIISRVPFLLNIYFFRWTFQILLLRFHIFIFSASFIKSSRKSGWAMLINNSARSQAVRPFKFTIPYSVTT